MADTHRPPTLAANTTLIYETKAGAAGWNASTATGHPLMRREKLCTSSDDVGGGREQPRVRGEMASLFSTISFGFGTAPPTRGEVAVMASSTT